MVSLRLLGSVVVLLSVPAFAQSDTGYESGRPCRFYVVRHLPVPVRCLAELQGNWGPHPYIDGEFAFRDHGEFLRWRDREDYRHWKAHDYAWRAGGVAASAPTTPIPAPVSPPVAATPRTVLCPAQVAVSLAPRASADGWTGGQIEMPARLDPTNPPHASGTLLTCTYALGAQRGAVMLSRPAGDAVCRPRQDGTGFDCTP